MNRHFYVELFPLSLFMPNFQPHRAASGLGTVSLVPKCHFPFPTAVSFLLTIAPSSAGLASTRHFLAPVFTGVFFFPGAEIGFFKNVASNFYKVT